jgi:hypothetical protein
VLWSPSVLGSGTWAVWSLANYPQRVCQGGAHSTAAVPKGVTIQPLDTAFHFLIKGTSKQRVGGLAL